MAFNFKLNHRHHYRKIRRPFGLPPVILILLFFGLVSSEPRAFPLFLLILPFLILWFFVRIASFLVRRMRQGVEEFWRDHLEAKDDPLLEEKVSYPQQQEAPESIRNNEQLMMLWERAMRLRNVEGLQRTSKNVLRQTHALGDLFDRFQILLKAKLSPHELTYRRFLTSATQGYEMIHEELKKALSRMEHLQTVESSLRPTADDTGFSSSTYQELHQEQLTQIDHLLSQTQEAIAQLARVNISIGQMRGVSSRKEGDISNAIHELKDLANRAKQL